MRKFLAFLMAFVMMLTLVIPAMAETSPRSNDTVILYTNDIHTYIDGDLSYDVIAALKSELETRYETVLLVDAGDHIQGTAYGSMDKGKSIIELMNAAGYDVATLGNHEFDYGMAGCMNAIDWAEFPYVSCNFYHEENGVRGEDVLDSYVIFECGEEKIAFIGISTPETFTKTTPAYFQDENGNYIYGISGGDDGEELYAQVQKSIDAAEAAGATKIIALGHLGDDPSSRPWTSEETIANVSGLDAFIDGHSHSTVEAKIVPDMDGNEVHLTQTGEYFGTIGKMVIDSETGQITTELLTAEDLADIVPDADVKAIKDAWIGEIDAQLGQKIGSSEVSLDNYDTEGNRLVRVQETNSGDFCADALYYLFDSMDLDVDVAVMNGGGIRNQTITGDISYKTCKDMHPFGNVACLQTVTGQQILDMLEWGSRHVGVSEDGSFLHVSGISYKIDTSIADTTQADDKDVWVGGPTEYRVHDVKVYNKDTNDWDALELDAEYHLAGYNYTLRDLGGGFAMLDGAVNVLDYVMEDYMVLANYVQSFEGGIVKAGNSPLAEKYENFTVDYGTVYGSGRICVEEDTSVTFNIWVGGTQITGDNAADVMGDGTVSYDADTNTLTLNGADIVVTDGKYGIQTDGALDVELIGTNKVICSGFYGLYANDAVTIGGSGSLEVTGSGFGIYTSGNAVGALTIRDSVTVTARSGDVISGSSYGIRADGALTICDDAVVTAIGGAADSDSYGIHTTNMTVSGGSVYATSGGADQAYGIWAFGDISLADCDVTVRSEGDGIFTWGSLSIDCNEVTTSDIDPVLLIGTRVDVSAKDGSNGIYAACGLTLSERSTISTPEGGAVIENSDEVGWTITGGDGMAASSVEIEPLAYRVLFEIGDLTLGTIIPVGQSVAGARGAWFLEGLARHTEREGYVFTGWYTEDGSEYDLDTAVTGDITIFAKWTAQDLADDEGDDDSDSSTVPAVPEDIPQSGDTVIWLYWFLLLIASVTLLTVLGWSRGKHRTIK